MKNEVAEYIARCIECQQVKAEHRHPTGLLQPLLIQIGNEKLSVLILLLDYLKLKTKWLCNGSSRQIKQGNPFYTC